MLKTALYLSKPAVAGYSFFCLDTKEPKSQECRIASGRHSSHRAWAVTFMAMTLLVLIFVAFTYCF